MESTSWLYSFYLSLLNPSASLTTSTWIQVTLHFTWTISTAIELIYCLWPCPLPSPLFLQPFNHNLEVTSSRKASLLTFLQYPKLLQSQHFSNCVDLITWANSFKKAKAVSLLLIKVSILLLFSHWVVSNSLWPHGLQHTRLPCLSPTPEACSNSGPLSRWWYPAISSSVVPFSSCLQSFPASGSFPMSQLFTSGDQSIAALASASVLLMNIQYIAGCLLYIGFSKLEWMNERMVGSGAKEVSQHVKRVRKDR